MKTQLEQILWYGESKPILNEYQMVPDVKELIWRDEVIGQKSQWRFSIEWGGTCGSESWMPAWFIGPGVILNHAGILLHVNLKYRVRFFWEIIHFWNEENNSLCTWNLALWNWPGVIHSIHALLLNFSRTNPDSFMFKMYLDCTKTFNF